MTLSDPRFLSMSCWLQQLFGKPLQAKLISGDASFRRYFRLNVDGCDYIVTDSPPNLLDNKPLLPWHGRITKLVFGCQGA